MQSADYDAKSPYRERTHWMRVLALANTNLLNQAFAKLNHVPCYHFLRQPESGIAMVRARTGGTGAQFNLGEISISRCTVAISKNTVVGISHVQGRDLRHAEQAAVIDALLQIPAWHERIQSLIIQPLAHAHATARDKLAQAAAKTKVEFFTLARGED